MKKAEGSGIWQLANRHGNMRGTSPATARLWAERAPYLKQELFVAKKFPKKKAFLTDVKTLRARARKHLNDGAIGSNYVGDVKMTIAILQSVLATELVCV